MHFSGQLPTQRVKKGAEFTSGTAIGEMARAVAVFKEAASDPEPGSVRAKEPMIAPDAKRGR